MQEQHNIISADRPLKTAHNGSVPGSMPMTSAELGQTLTGHLRWRVFSSRDQLDEALAIWRLLESRMQSTSVACSATWVETWLSAYGDIVPSEIHVAECDGLVRGICLLTSGQGQKNGPFLMKTRHFGTAGEPQPGSVCVEYNRLLVEPSFRFRFVAGLCRQVQSDTAWEEFHLDGFEESELSEWQEFFPGAVVRARDSRYFDLAEARHQKTDVISSLGRSTRSNLRRRLKQYGTLTCEWAESLEQAEEIFQELITLHQARWQAVGEAGAFASSRFEQFQKTACLKLFLEDKAVLFRVRQQDETVGCLFLLNDQNRLLDYLSGFASFEEKPSPGLISHYLCMEEALKRGFRAYDFLVGDKRHKENLSTHSSQLCWLTVSRPGWKRTLAERLRQAKKCLTHWKASLKAARTTSTAEPPTSSEHSSTPLDN